MFAVVDDLLHIGGDDSFLKLTNIIPSEQTSSYTRQDPDRTCDTGGSVGTGRYGNGAVHGGEGF